jgi:hypothetical protein
MIKKMILLAALAFTLATTVSATASYPQYPIPGCYPCNGGGN